jgi:hypothetical protein
LPAGLDTFAAAAKFVKATALMVEKSQLIRPGPMSLFRPALDDRHQTVTLVRYGNSFVLARRIERLIENLVAQDTVDREQQKDISDDGRRKRQS